MNVIPPSHHGKAGILNSLSNFTSKVTKSMRRLSGAGRDDKYSCFEAAGANLRASDSRITDFESAREIIEYTKSKILSRAARSLSGQANQSQRRIISLIQ